MNIQKYMAFTETVEKGSFTRAAQALNYSQSGISRMIGDLEEEWGVVLLERGKAGVKLTSDGLRLLPYAQSLCREYVKLKTRVDELRGLQTGLIRIGAFSSAAAHLLPDIIKDFQRDYPNIDYEILAGGDSEIEEWIREGRVDCGFLRIPTKFEFDTMFLHQDEFVVILPENHPLKDLERFPISALNTSPFLLLERGDSAEVSEILERCGIRPQVHLTTLDDYAIMSMVEKGLGISILPRLILKRCPYNIIIKRLEVPVYRNIGIALRDRKSASLAVQRFLDYLPDRQL